MKKNKQTLADRAAIAMREWQVRLRAEAAPTKKAQKVTHRPRHKRQKLDEKRKSQPPSRPEALSAHAESMMLELQAGRAEYLLTTRGVWQRVHRGKA
jgi:hypothetical protein